MTTPFKDLGITAKIFYVLFMTMALSAMGYAICFIAFKTAQLFNN